jgi:hypothetical protein
MLSFLCILLNISDLSYQKYAKFWEVVVFKFENFVKKKGNSLFSPFLSSSTIYSGKEPNSW